MSIITLTLARSHMKIDADMIDDELLQLYIDAAEQYCSNYLGKDLADLDTVPADIKIAILRLVAYYHEVRNLASFGVSIQMAPQSINSILDSYREEWFTDGA